MSTPTLARELIHSAFALYWLEKLPHVVLPVYLKLSPGSWYALMGKRRTALRETIRGVLSVFRARQPLARIMLQHRDFAAARRKDQRRHFAVRRARVQYARLGFLPSDDRAAVSKMRRKRLSRRIVFLARLHGRLSQPKPMLARRVVHQVFVSCWLNSCRQIVRPLYASYVDMDAAKRRVRMQLNSELNWYRELSGARKDGEDSEQTARRLLTRVRRDFHRAVTQLRHVKARRRKRQRVCRWCKAQITLPAVPGFGRPGPRRHRACRKKRSRQLQVGDLVLYHKNGHHGERATVFKVHRNDPQGLYYDLSFPADPPRQRPVVP